jgi:hypothetical protein
VYVSLFGALLRCVQARWGYQNLSVFEDVVANYSAAGLPLENIFADIEYQGDNFRTMTFSEGADLEM